MDIAIVILAGYGLRSIVDAVKDNTAVEKFKKVCYVFFGIAGLMLIISIVGFQDSYSSAISSSPLVDRLKQQGANAQQISQYTKQIATVAYENSVSDLRLHAFFIILLTGLAYMYATKKVSLKIFLAGTILIGMIDRSKF
jgi:hypothetical protein